MCEVNSIQSIGASTSLQNGAPNPLHQKFSSVSTVEIERSPFAIFHNGPDVTTSTTSSVQPLAKISDLGGCGGVLAGVPGVHQGVRRELGQLVPDDADHAVDARVAIGRSEAAGAASAHVAGDGEGVGAELRALLAGVPNPGVG